MADYQTAAPSQCPAQFKASVALLHRDAVLILDSFSVPYSVQAALSDDGYVRISDLADRYSDSKEVRQNAPAELGFEPNKNNFTDKTSKFVAMRLAQAMERARSSSSTGTWQLKGATGPMQTIQNTLGSITELGPGVRDTLQELWKQKTGESKAPDLSEQGSDSFILAFLKCTAKGEIGFFPQKHIVSKLPDPEDIQPQEKRYKLESGGFLAETQDYTASTPVSFQKWQIQNRIFRNTLLMATWSHSTFQQFDLSLEEAKAFYDFLEGPEVASRRPAPSLAVIMVAERKAWREIALKMHNGHTLAQSVKKQMESFLFWQREVYERISGTSQRDYSQQDDQYRRGKGAPGPQPTSYRPTSNATKSKKGKYKGKGKGYKGKSHKGDPPTKLLQQWPSTWANKDLKGSEFCRRFHLGGNCTGDCNTGRSHSCPVFLKNGHQCNQHHRGVNCKHHA
jgi:hypothetical protein